MGHRTKRTPEARAKILACIADGLTMSAAAKTAGMDRRAVFNWRRDDAEFSKDFETAYAIGTDVYVDEARRRALNGSDNLLALILRARDPARWGTGTKAALGETVANETADNVVFYLPDNARHEPEVISGDELPEEVKQRLLTETAAEPPKRRALPGPVTIDAPFSSWRRLASRS